MHRGSVDFEGSVLSSLGDHDCDISSMSHKLKSDLRVITSPELPLLADSPLALMPAT